MSTFCVFAGSLVPKRVSWEEPVGPLPLCGLFRQAALNFPPTGVPPTKVSFFPSAGSFSHGFALSNPNRFCMSFLFVGAFSSRLFFHFWLPISHFFGFFLVPVAQVPSWEH